MKALLVAAFALTLAIPAMAQTAAPVEHKDAPAVDAPKTTYEQAFTECAEATKDAAGEKAAAVKTCMLEKGFELKDEAAPAADKHSALDGAVFAEAEVTSTTAVTTTTPATTVTTDAAGTTVTTTEGAVAPSETTTTETTVDGAAATTTTTTTEKH